jgi:hypothetical protein
MSIGRVNFDNISATDLQDLIHASVPEGLVIEYKRDRYGNSDADKKEALKDITSFANSAGGHLIIGMEEADGIPTRLTGLPGVDVDAEINRLESLVRDGVEPRTVGIRIRRVNLADGGAAVIIRIPRSWNPPHRVSTAKTNRFYVRNSGGAHEASVEELRVLFTLAAEIGERIKNFRADRMAKIKAGQGPVRLPGGGRLIVHLIPLSAFGQTTTINLGSAWEVRQQFCPMGPSDIRHRFNLDGLINECSGEECYGYTQVFRNGIVEATRANIVAEWDDVKILHWDYMMDIVPAYFDGLRALDVPVPIIFMVSYQGVAGARLGIERSSYRLAQIQPFPHDIDPVLLPEVIVDDYGSREEYIGAMRPIFDTLWNAAGLPRCSFYDDKGHWTGPR